MNVWVEAARPRTLVAGVVPVIVGTAAAERLILWRAAAALTVSVAVQVGVNYANDLFDGLRGIDGTARVGPRRAVASGLVPPARMRAAMVVAFAVCAAAGLPLAIAVDLRLLVVGALSLAAAIGYSGGRRPYGSMGLGEVSVFLFFGLVATAGSAYVQDERLRVLPVTAAVPVGLLATAILVVNNLRDAGTDAAAGKHTLAVRLGPRATGRLYDALVLAAFASLALAAAADDGAWPLLAAASAPLAGGALRAVAGGGPQGLARALGMTARLELAFGTLLAVGLWMS